MVEFWTISVDPLLATESHVGRINLLEQLPKLRLAHVVAQSSADFRS